MQIHFYSLFSSYLPRVPIFWAMTVCIHIYVFMYVCMYVCVYIHIHIYIYTYILLICGFVTPFNNVYSEYINSLLTQLNEWIIKKNRKNTKSLFPFLLFDPAVVMLHSNKQTINKGLMLRSHLQRLLPGAGDEAASGCSHYWLPWQRIRCLAAKYKHFGGKYQFNPYIQSKMNEKQPTFYPHCVCLSKAERRTITWAQPSSFLLAVAPESRSSFA